MARVLIECKVQALHLGNILERLSLRLKMAHQTENDAFIFIADLHSLTD